MTKQTNVTELKNNFTHVNAFTSAIKNVGKQSTLLHTIAKFGIEQVALHGNKSPIIEAFNATDENEDKVFYLKSGLLNKLGNDFKNYITTQYKGVTIKENKKEKTLTIDLKDKASGQEKNYVVDVIGSRIQNDINAADNIKSNIVEFWDEPIRETGALLISFNDFTDYGKVKIEPTVKPFTLADLSKQASKLAESIEKKGLTASLVELSEAQTLFASIDTLINGKLNALRSEALAAHNSTAQALEAASEAHRQASITASEQATLQGSSEKKVMIAKVG